MRRLVLVPLTVTLMLTGCGYNRIQTLDEQVNAYKGQIEVQLQRRADLVPNLVEVVKGFAAQEQAIFDAVTSARAALSGAVQGGSLAEMAAANGTLTSALGRLIAIAEDNPEIKSNENFRMLQDQLEGTENRIAVARRDYIEAVRAYNTELRTFPGVLWANTFFRSSKPMAEFTANEDAQTPPAVKF
jgi:LemA protein